MTADSQRRERDLGTFLLNSMIAVLFLGGLVVVTLYTIPPEHLDIPQHELAVRVARLEDFPVGGSRLETWGPETILVVRRGESEFAALNAISPVDGCILSWDLEALRITSPCGHQVYNLRGNVVEGLTTESLQQYGVFVRNDIVYVTRN
jgi:nitrite reductase/ring-hydroxylating ferredoxin subunit